MQSPTRPSEQPGALGQTNCPASHAGVPAAESSLPKRECIQHTNYQQLDAISGAVNSLLTLGASWRVNAGSLFVLGPKPTTSGAGASAVQRRMTEMVFVLVFNRIYPA